MKSLLIFRTRSKIVFKTVKAHKIKNKIFENIKGSNGNIGKTITGRSHCAVRKGFLGNFTKFTRKYL